MGDDIFREEISGALSEASGRDIPGSLLEIPPNADMGDFAFPCFNLAKELRKSPVEIAKDIASRIHTRKLISSAVANGPYVNFFVVKEELSKNVLNNIFKSGRNYGSKPGTGRLVLVESPGPNTNKPLHLGHVRNMVLGNALQSIFGFLGNRTKRIDMVNDRGVHICKSMLAYKKFGNNLEPDKKTDHFVGDYYVRYDQESKKDPGMEKETQEMLLKWEEGDKETLALWKKMNDWAVSGIQQTYIRYGVDMDKPYFESDHYMKGKEVVTDGLSTGLFKRDEKGNVYYSDDEIEKKIVLRADGTSIYITQDIILGKIRYDDWHMDKMIYVVANEQNHHFKVLFRIFERLGYPFAKDCYHLGYGMIYLPEGKMKSREGNVVDADNLADEMRIAAKKEVLARYPDIADEDAEKRAEAIGMAAIKFYILSYDPLKDFIFNPKESISFDGETGPYVQYAHARACSVLKKSHGIPSSDIDYSKLETEEEKSILKILEAFPKAVERAGEEYKPSIITRNLLDLSQAFNEFYHKHKIIQEDKELEKSRILLVFAVKQVLETGLHLLGIEAPEIM